MSRGRVLIRPVARPASALWNGAGGVVRLMGLCVGLILFGGLFQYVIDLKPAYLLAKAWPVLTLPLTLWAAVTLRPGHQPLVLAALAWMLAATGFIGIWQLGNDGLGAVASTVKIWPLTGAIGACAALTWARPTAGALTAAVATLALLTFGFLAGAWTLLPPEAFNGAIETTKVFLTDAERGPRINAPMMYAIMGLFLLNRFAWRTRGARRWIALAVIALGLVLMLTIYKQRAQIAGTAVVLLFGAVMSAGRWRGPALLGLAAVACGLIVPAWLWLQTGDAVQTLGGSLSMRQTEAAAAVAFLNDEPWRWVTGVGSATRIGGVTLGDIVGTPFFFPSDLGWLGVVFEYGLIGTGLMLALHVAAVRIGWKAVRAGERRGGGLMALAVFDYAVFLLVVSPIVSVALAPGELATCLALGWWLNRPDENPPVRRA